VPFSAFSTFSPSLFEPLFLTKSYPLSPLGLSALPTPALSSEGLTVRSLCGSFCVFAPSPFPKHVHTPLHGAPLLRLEFFFIPDSSALLRFAPPFFFFFFFFFCGLCICFFFDTMTSLVLPHPCTLFFFCEIPELSVPPRGLFTFLWNCPGYGLIFVAFPIFSVFYNCFPRLFLLVALP